MALGVTERARMPQETISRLCEWYTSTVMPARANRPSTRLQDARILTRLAAYLREQGVTTVTELAAQPNALNAYVLHRQTMVSSSTINKELAVFRAVMRAAVEYALIDTPPVRRWPRLCTPDTGYPEPLSREDFTRVLDAMRDSVHYHAVRFIAYTGCRPSDACNLRRGDLHDLYGHEPTAMIRQVKTGRYVAIALSPPAVDAVCDSLARDVASDYVFCRTDAQPFTPASVSISVVRRAKALGIACTPKSFRQSIVSRLYDRGADDMLVRRITGHQSDAIGAYRRLRRGAAHELASIYADEMRGGDT